MIRNPLFIAGDSGSIPGWGTNPVCDGATKSEHN